MNSGGWAEMTGTHLTVGRGCSFLLLNHWPFRLFRLCDYSGNGRAARFLQLLCRAAENRIDGAAINQLLVDGFTRTLRNLGGSSWILNLKISLIQFIFIGLCSLLPLTLGRYRPIYFWINGRQWIKDDEVRINCFAARQQGIDCNNSWKSLQWAT